MMRRPSWNASASTVATPSATSLTVALTASSCSGKPMPRNWIERLRSASGPSPAALTARATWAIIHRPWRMRPGRPTDWANSSSMWIGLKSPEAPA